MTVIPRGDRFGVKVKAKGRQKWIGTFETEAEAQKIDRRWSVKIEEAIENGTLDELLPPKRQDAPPEPKSVRWTCRSFAEAYVETYCSDLAPATQAIYGAPLRFFAKRFGDAPLDSIDKPTARKWAGTQSRNTRNVIRTMYANAAKDRIVDDNPFASLGFKESRGRKDLEVIKLPELLALADKAVDVFGPDFGPTYRAQILFSAFVGLRPGELFALLRTDLLLNHEVRGQAMPSVWIKRNLDTTGGIKAPKNGHARRVILPSIAAEALSAVRPPAKAPEYVFATPTGVRLSRSTNGYLWRKVAAAAGVPGMDYYELRHFCATYLLEKGVLPSDVAVQLGHTDGGALVMSTYGHPEEDRARLRVLNAFEDDDPPALSVAA